MNGHRHRLTRLGAGALVALLLAAAAVLAVTGHAESSESAEASSPAAAGLPDLRPPHITVLRRDPSLAPGQIFLGAKDLSARPGDQGGPLIVDDLGRPVWFKPLPAGAGGERCPGPELRGKARAHLVAGGGAWAVRATARARTS